MALHQHRRLSTEDARKVRVPQMTNGWRQGSPTSAHMTGVHITGPSTTARERTTSGQRDQAPAKVATAVQSDRMLMENVDVENVAMRSTNACCPDPVKTAMMRYIPRLTAGIFFPFYPILGLLSWEYAVVPRSHRNCSAAAI